MRPLVVGGLLLAGFALTALTALTARAGPPPQSPGATKLTTFKDDAHLEAPLDAPLDVSGTAHEEPATALHESGNSPAPEHGSTNDVPNQPAEQTAAPAGDSTSPPGDAGRSDSPGGSNAPRSISSPRSKAGGGRAAGTAGTPPVSAASEAAAASAGAGRAFAAAAKMAATLKQGAASAEMLGAAGSASAASAAGAKPGSPSAHSSAAPAASALDVSSPRGTRELLLAAGPYAQVFAANGLRGGMDSAGRPAIMRADGKPATDDELARLRAGIRAAPGALAVEPGFFQRISPEQYGAVREALVSRPELKKDALKDVAESADDAKRDLVWDKNCEMVTGECNASADKDYKKGKIISGADLARIWAKIRDRFAAKDAAVSGENAPAAGIAAAESDAADGDGGSAAAERREDASPTRTGGSVAGSAAARRDFGDFSTKPGKDAPALVPSPRGSASASGPFGTHAVSAGLVAASVLFFILAAKRGRRADERAPRT